MQESELNVHAPHALLAFELAVVRPHAVDPMAYRKDLTLDLDQEHLQHGPEEPIGSETDCEEP